MDDQLLDTLSGDGFEQVVFCTDAATGLRSIIAIHDTTLGPALGGVRMQPYKSSSAALDDVLRLAKAMTLKSAAAGLDLGGGKSVIIGDPAVDKTEGLLRAHGRYIASLGGRYIPGIDVGTSQADMDLIAKEAPIVACRGTDPSYYTALGTKHAIAAAAQHTLHRDLDGLTVMVQGAGHVGSYLCSLLQEAGATVTVSDVDRRRTDAVQAACPNVKVLEPDEALRAEVDIFAPCALGGIIDDDSVEQLRCAAVVGAANNVLATPTAADRLRQRDITYVPDYYANAGGVICLQEELQGATLEQIAQKVGLVGARTTMVLERARRESTTTTAAGEALAQERIRDVRRIGVPYVPSASSGVWGRTF